MATEINSVIRNGDVHVRTIDLIKSLLEDKNEIPKDYPVHEYIDDTIAELLRYESEILRQHKNGKTNH